MFRWVPYAMVRIAAFFVAGILLGIYQPQLGITTRLLLTGALAVLYFVISLRYPRQRTWVGTIGLVAIAAFGYTHVYWSND
ncbi:MAG: hypothetical protein ACK576_14565, partial [Cyclobacteriaceae bacterium]